MTDKYIVKAEEIAAMEGTAKTHFLNDNAVRNNKSLGDLTGLTGLGFHIIEVQPGHESTEYHVHYCEDECTYVLSGEGTVTIGETTYPVSTGDFIGYRAGGLAHTMHATGHEPLVCIVVGQRLSHDVGDYPNKCQRIYRQAGMPWNLVGFDDIKLPVAGEK
ncbi:MAG: cupin domain-containing protein [Pseudomonadota bacterium]